MAVSQTIATFLKNHDARYEVIRHPHTSSSMQTAVAADVAPERLAKGVLLHDGERYFLAIVPASRRLRLKVLTETFGHRPELVLEDDLPRIFPDCEPGAVPALGAAYGLECIVDRWFRTQSEVFLEAGDHEVVIRLDGATFERLMGTARWESISETEY